MKVIIVTAKDCPHRTEILNTYISTFDFCAFIEKPSSASKLAMKSLLTDVGNWVNIKSYKVTDQGHPTIADNGYFGGIFFSAAIKVTLMAALIKHGFAIEDRCQPTAVYVLKI